MSRIDDYVDALRRSLPATTRDELSEKMKVELGYPVSIGIVDGALAYVRKRGEELEWTVPHVKRGVPGWGEENRYFRLPAERSGRFALTQERRDHHDAGLNSTVQTFTTQAGNLQTQVTMLAEHETLRVHRQYIEYIGDMLESVSRGMRRLQNIVAEKRAA